MVEMREAIINDWHRENPRVLTPSRLNQSPRQVIIEAYVDYAVAPEDVVQMFMGSTFHEKLANRRREVGHRVQREARVAGKLWGFDVSAEPDAIWPGGEGPGGSTPIRIMEDKFTTSGSIGFILRASQPKADHVFQVNVARHLLAQVDGIDPETIPARINYFCLPQKENIKHLGGWVRVPANVPFPVPFRNEDQLGDHTPGWNPPEKPTQPAIPTSTARENAIILTEAHAQIAAGKPVVDVLKALECQCPRRFMGTGREYCEMSRWCAILDHGSPSW